MVVKENASSLIGPSKSYSWKEQLMQKVQKELLTNLDNIQTQQDLDSFIDSKIDVLRQEMEQTLGMISNTLKKIPLDVLKRASIASVSK